MAGLEVCRVCGQGAEGRCTNHWCRRADRSFSVIFSVGAYSSRVRDALARYKYDGDRRVGRVFAAQLAQLLIEKAPWFEEFDVLTSAPAFTGPGARRSWDHVGEILAAAGALLGPGWDVSPGLVVKRFETPALTGRSLGGRRSVARGPLRRSLMLAPGASVSGSRVLVFDDVMTEGSTMRETARVLLGAGACDVAGVVLARPEWTRSGR